MANLFMRFAVFMASAVATCNCIPMPHIIGGGLNTGKPWGVWARDPSPNWLKSALSSLEFSGNVASREPNSEISNVPQNLFHIIATENEPAAPVLLHKYPSAVPDLGDSNPFLRSKRSAEDTCEFPASLPETVAELNSHLNASQVVGLNPEQPEYTPLNEDEPSTCPSAGNQWWPKQSVNLRSTCPWNYTEKDLGVNAFPRYLREAHCLCESCINASAMGCEEIKQDVTVFFRQGCSGGVALLNKVEIPITVGCHCVHAPIPSTNDIPDIDYTI